MSALDICSAALVLIGAQPITSFEEGSAEAVACTHLYEPVVRDLFSLHRWRFAATQVEMVRLADPPEARFEAAYQLPTGMIDVYAVTSGDRPIAYRRYLQTILCDAGADDVLVAECSVRVNEAVWPAYFSQLVRLKLASQLALGLAAQETMSATLAQQAEVQLARARHADAVQHTTRSLPRGRLAFGRRRGWGLSPERTSFYW